ncbi:DUF1295-domain-containing protein [Pluteus cervinus]|uniref:DUF1295-domain-containing protein n=1 Tax=Pluteus cervinus TaxID=181527 RepID=A0ACD3BBP4_9AGAR|nr:DUF1295-domain-containing protein [Pluteus cervinus]
MAAFSRLFPTFASAYALQMVLGSIFVPLQDERFYDMGGSLGWLSTTFISLYYPALKARFVDGNIGPLPALSTFAPRQLLLTAAVGLWSARLGYFLGTRAIKAGGDSRFDVIKKKPTTFFAYWMAQATWIALVGLPVWLVNTLPASRNPPLGLRDYAAFGLFAGSWLFEIIADRQKTKWRRAKDDKEHDEKFITKGLWAISRHPNYVGEAGLWAGIYALSTSSLQTPYFPPGTVALAALSPLFTWFLLRKVSGVPPLERAGNKKFRDDPRWAEYKRTVPIFFPWGGYE